VTPCSPVKDQPKRFREAYYFHLQGVRVSQFSNLQEENKKQAYFLPAYSYTLKMEVIRFSETLVNFYEIHGVKSQTLCGCLAQPLTLNMEAV
jgi:hypothetical protein